MQFLQLKTCLIFRDSFHDMLNLQAVILTVLWNYFFCYFHSGHMCACDDIWWHYFIGWKTVTCALGGCFCCFEFIDCYARLYLLLLLSTFILHWLDLIQIMAQTLPLLVKSECATKGEDKARKLKFGVAWASVIVQKMAVDKVRWKV